MSARQEAWAIVLAAGDGTRLSSLTTNARGEAVPKQYCSLNGGPSLLQEALQRAQRIVSRERVCAVVACRHEHHWRRTLGMLPARNVIVQPRNCGTANGVLLGLLHILDRDPLAHIVFLPADHYVHNEAALADSMRMTAMLSHDRDGLTLLGIEPDDIDIELGYIVPGDALEQGIRRVERFVEKPSAASARELIARGALWNSFIFWARGSTLLELIRGRLSEIAEEMINSLVRDRRGGGMSAVKGLYERLPVIDFSRAVMQGAESALRVRTAPGCGWTDLGTPRRVARTLQRLRLASIMQRPEHVFPLIASVDLATQYARLWSLNSAAGSDL